ncbi:nicotinamide riboside transporter PnuC [Mesoplasma lactucae]|uniref:Uncharacterized protein n=1 Tax=Mesoplasma lactucae ATCC 49193 TaxID=81460 RepID=A0A291IR62_9MOLU|nr:nicotinamide riboside transporter PnuC [Mesoplasma lactucae]ATG97228.1 hypothetical protein CP520_00415 [Mesoplasma lactucae ATCC 49193]ATZ20330.1 nicotinamide mononucleotide transporter PnuC [Mesoplasma lactucae ATCC 49193]MCL8216501.1 hypothetical protein [Mesoplasma lactucae ATCC 49193]
MKNFLGINNVKKDIMNLSSFFKWLLVLSTIAIVVFNFVSVKNVYETVFLPLQQYHKVLDKGSQFGKTQSAAITIAILYSLNGLAAFTGVIAIIMISQNKVSQYFWGAINFFFFGLFALSVGYVGDFFMNFIRFFGAPIGWYLFEKKGYGKRQAKKEGWKYNLIFYSILLVLSFIITMFWYWALPNASTDLFGKTNNQYLLRTPDVNGKNLQILDGVANGLNTVGYVMQLINLSQQFYVWLWMDIVKVLKFSGLAGKATLNINMLIQFSIWVFMCFVGIYKRSLEPIYKPKIDLWKASLKK